LFPTIWTLPPLHTNCYQSSSCILVSRHDYALHSRSEASVRVSEQSQLLLWGVVSTSPNLEAGGPPLINCPRLLIQYIRSCPPHWRPFL